MKVRSWEVVGSRAICRVIRRSVVEAVAWVCWMGRPAKWVVAVDWARWPASDASGAGIGGE